MVLLEDHRGAGQAYHEADEEGAGQRQPESDDDPHGQPGSQSPLQGAADQKRAAQGSHLSGADPEPDNEQLQNDADLGEHLDLLGLRYQSQARGSDEDAADQEANYRRDA